MFIEIPDTDNEALDPSGAFSYTNYRRLFIGNALSNVGTWFQMLAQALLVLKITGKASSLGEVFAIQTLPLLFFGPFVGSFIDRANLRRVLMFVSAVAGLEALALAFLVAIHHVNIEWIFGLSLVLGFSQVLTQPALQTIISELVPPRALASAVSLNTVQQSAGRLAGPALAGLIYAWSGPGTCFLINGISYVVVLVAVFSIRPDRFYGRPPRNRSPKQFIESIRYVRGSRLHRTQLLASLVVGCLAFNYPLFYSSFTHFALHKGSTVFGIAESINAVFAVTGGVIISGRLRHPTRRTYIVTCFGLGATLMNIAFAPNVLFFYLDMIPFGLSVVAYSTVNQALLQLNTPRERIGSVMTLLAYTTQGTTPIGSLIVGWVVSLLSARYAIGMGAVSALGAGVVLLLIQLRRPVVTGGPEAALLAS